MFAKFVVRLVALFFGLNLATVAHADESEWISSSGGQFFDHRVEISVPAFAQDDPRWSDVKLGGSTDTLGYEGCAVTSAAMVAAFYGIKTDPQKLNDFLTRTGGLDSEGLIDWNLVPSVAPNCWELAYNGIASYERIDKNLLAGNPVIVLIPLRDGASHFVVIVGKEGRDYLIRDPANSDHPYPLREITGRINGLCIFRSVHPQCATYRFAPSHQPCGDSLTRTKAGDGTLSTGGRTLPLWTSIQSLPTGPDFVDQSYPIGGYKLLTS
jgi:hypothetical protein